MRRDQDPSAHKRAVQSVLTTSPGVTPIDEAQKDAQNQPVTITPPKHASALRTRQAITAGRL
jgi:hypothetical protein